MEKSRDKISATRTLYLLANSVIDAYDYFKDECTEPKYTDFFLYRTRQEAEQKAQKLDTDSDIYNECTIYTVEMTEQEILDISGYQNIDEFDEALSGGLKNYKLAMEIMSSSEDEENIWCANYDFEKSLEGCILLFWSWERHPGYARNCLDVRRALSSDKETLLAKTDELNAVQCDVLLTAEEVDEADDLQKAVREAIGRNSWKWTNEVFVKSKIREL